MTLMYVSETVWGRRNDGDPWEHVVTLEAREHHYGDADRLARAATEGPNGWPQTVVKGLTPNPPPREWEAQYRKEDQ